MNFFKKIKHAELILLLVLMFLTFFLRMYNTGELSAGDDSQYAFLAMSIIQKPVRAIYPEFIEGPVSYGGWKMNRALSATPIVPFIFIFGYTNLAVKFPSILFATFSTLFLYLILKKQFNAKVAALAALLFAVNPFHIAFTRGGFVHSSLVFYLLLSAYLLMKGFEKKKVGYFYFAALLFLASMLTTDFRGIVPATGFIIYVILSRPDKQQIKHLFFAGVLAVSVWLCYFLLPLLWHEPAYLNWVLFIFKHESGTMNTINLYPASVNILLMGKYLVFTPFIGLIFAPFIFGLIYSLRNISKRQLAFWVFWFLSIILFYVNKQPSVERQLVYVPAFVTFAALGLYYSYVDFAKKKNGLFFPLLIFFTLIHYLSIAVLFPRLFPAEASIFDMVLGFAGLTHIFSDAVSIFIMCVLIFLVSLFIWSVGRFKHVFVSAKALGKSLIILFLFLNIVCSFALVYLGVGVYHRPEEIKQVADYIQANNGGAEFSCLTHLSDKALTFYTGKICAAFPLVNVSWIKTQVSEGNLNFFVLERYYPTLGIDLEESDANIAHFYPEEYAWIMNNTIDITHKAGLNPDNPYLELREVV